MMQEENVTKCQWIEQLYNCLSPSEVWQHFLISGAGMTSEPFGPSRFSYEVL